MIDSLNNGEEISQLTTFPNTLKNNYQPCQISDKVIKSVYF